MKIRKNKLKINTLKLVYHKGTIEILLKHFKGSYYKTAEYITSLAKDGYTTKDSSELTEKGKLLLQKVTPNFF